MLSVVSMDNMSTQVMQMFMMIPESVCHELFTGIF